MSRPPKKADVLVFFSNFLLYNYVRILLYDVSAPCQDIRYIVSEALQIFDEDKTGQADYALEALGGSVITVGCTG